MVSFVSTAISLSLVDIAGQYSSYSFQSIQSSKSGKFPKPLKPSPTIGHLPNCMSKVFSRMKSAQKKAAPGNVGDAELCKHVWSS